MLNYFQKLQKKVLRKADYKTRYIKKRYAIWHYNRNKNNIDDALSTFSPFLNIYRFIHIESARLTHYLTDACEQKTPVVGDALFVKCFIRKGDWDTCKRPILPDYINQPYVGSIKYRSIYQIFKENIPYQECDWYKELLSQKGRDKAEKWYEDIVNLYHSLKQNGYQLQHNLPATIRKKNVMNLDEIRIAISRNGEYYRLREHGNRRLALASILGIEIIPVYVQGVHYDWAIKCLEKHGGDLLSSINKELASMDLKYEATGLS